MYWLNVAAHVYLVVDLDIDASHCLPMGGTIVPAGELINHCLIYLAF